MKKQTKSPSEQIKAVARKRKSPPLPAEVQAWDPKLHRPYRHLRKILNDSGADDLLARYKIGRIAGEIQNEAVYGEGAVEQMAQALDVSADWLYVCRMLADTFPKLTTFEKLVRRRNSRGRTIGVSHIVEILRLTQRDPGALDSLLEQFFEGSLTARELAKLGKEAKHVSGRVKPKSTVASLAVLRSSNSTWLDKVEDCWDLIDENLAHEDDPSQDAQDMAREARDSLLVIQTRTADILRPIQEFVDKCDADLAAKEAAKPTPSRRKVVPNPRS